MDKNKKSDLLAAGRKKLQQFRQKKDSKGSKSSGKSSKSERDADADALSATGKPAGVSQKDSDEGRSEYVSEARILGSSASDVTDDSMSADIDAGTVDSAREPVLNETGIAETASATNLELPLEESGVSEIVLNHSVGKGDEDDYSIPYEGGSAHAAHPVGAGVSTLETLETVVSEGESKNVGSEAGVGAVEVECPRREDQEADSSGSKQVDRGSWIELEDDKGMRLSAETHAETPGNTSTEEASHEEGKSSEPDDVSGSAGASNEVEIPKVDWHSVLAQPLPKSDGSAAECQEVTVQQAEVVVAGSSSEEMSEMASTLGDGGKTTKGVQEDIQDKIVDVEGSLMSKGHRNERSVDSKILTLSSGADASSISLSQLAVLLRGLDEDEFMFLLMSRESPPAKLTSAHSLNVPASGSFHVLERLKEQLYLTNFAKDIFHLELAEQSELQMELDHQHQQLLDKISVSSSSLNEVQTNNGSLAEELEQCRSELQVVAGEREVLQRQFDMVKGEAHDFTSRVDELQIKLERSQEDLSSLSTELGDCKDLVVALRFENENLNRSLISVTKDRTKLIEEKENIASVNDKLASELTNCQVSLETLKSENVSLNGDCAVLREERRKLGGEKEYFICENGKLLTDVAEFKGLVETLQVENTNLNGDLATVMEERKKLGEEKEYFVRETGKLSTELTGCKGLVEALQIEIANLHDSLVSLTEERNKLGEENMNFISENEKQLTELADCKGLIAGLEVECSKAVDNLKEATLHVDQLTEENMFLKSSLDLHKAKLNEFDDSQRKLLSQSEEVGNPIECSDVPSVSHESVPDDDGSQQIALKKEAGSLFPVLQKPLPDHDGYIEPLKQQKLDVSEDSVGFVDLKRHLEEAEKVMMDLEKAIEGMHSHSASLSRSISKAAAPGVSKLIQAFESKAHTDDHDLEELPLTENQSDVDLYILSKEHSGHLRALFKELLLIAENSGELLKGERSNSMSAEVAFSEFKSHCEVLKEHSNNLEGANIELVVLYEVTRQHVCEIEAKKGEIVVLYEALRHQDIVLKAENSELGKKLSDFQSRITELQMKLDAVHRSSDETAFSIYNQVETLQKEVAEVLMLGQEWNSTVAWIVETVGKLDACIETFSSSGLSTGIHNGLDVGNRVAASVDAATKVIKDLQEKLEAAHHDHETMCCSYNEMNDKFNNLQGKNELAFDMLHKIHSNLRKLINDSCGHVEGSEGDSQNEKLLDPLHPSNYDALMNQFENFLGEKLQLESLNSKLSSEVMEKSKDIEELNKRCLSSDAILKLIEDVECVVELEGKEMNTGQPASQLESMISFLLQKYRESDEQVSLSREEAGIKGMNLSALQGQVDHLSFLLIQHENQILILKETLRTAEKDSVSVHSELQEKVAELEQSEQRISSLREKLSIAVTKGKSLIVQRESLKQSLAETSSQLEKCLKDLQSKDLKLLEFEEKLKTYSEAGERVEALESELSYIRNSATALRESFLLKDSVLQRIEEILEDLELPEIFHSRDIIEKIDWLARSVTGNSVPFTDWDQKSSVGGSYSDTGFVVMDACKEDEQPNSNSGDEFRRKYEELQNKFYGLAEQNEMLEQSLLERNNLVQRWEEILDRIDMTSQLRSMEPEDRIEWLGSALLDAQNQCNSLQQKIDSFETFRGTLTADLEESQRRITDLEAALQSQINEKEYLSKHFEILTRDHEDLSEKAAQFEVENHKLHYEVSTLQDKLDEELGAEDRIHHIEGEMRRLQELISDVLMDPVTEDLILGSGSTEYFERLLRRLIEKYTTLSLGKPVIEDAVDEHVSEKADATRDENGTRHLGDAEEQDVVALKRKLEEALGDLMHVKEDRERYMEKNQSLVCEVETLDRKMQDLQELLNQEEQKSLSVREKLNVAVRKGKSLVQQRDSMKQTIEELQAEVERLKSDVKLRENSLSEYELKVNDLSTYQERIEAMESESSFLRNRLAETEHHLRENGSTLSMLLNVLGDIDLRFELNTHDPVDKLKQLGKLWHDLHAAVAASENESRKSKRAAELLLAELNEVQERNDGLQEEIEKAASELSKLSKERESAEAARREALARLEKLSAVRSVEKNNLKSDVGQLKKGFIDINNLLGDVLSKDLKLLHNLGAGMKSCLKPSDAPDLVDFSFGGAPRGIISTNSETKEKLMSTDTLTDSMMQEHFDDNFAIELCSFARHHLQDFMTEIGTLREKLYEHSHSSLEEADQLSELVEIVHREMASQKESFEAMKREIIRLESIEKDKDRETLLLHRNISLLYEACTSSLTEIQHWKAQMAGKGFAFGTLGIDLESPTGKFFSGDLLSSEDSVRNMASKLSLAMKEFINKQADIVEAGQKEMKTAVFNLQKELQEKDIERDRICMELVNHIKEAEAAAKSYLEDLQPAKAQIRDLERQVHMMEEERITLEQRVKEFQDQEATSVDLQERVESLTDGLVAKEQEIEALMQALDEEEAQMGDLTDKNEKLESALQQKNLDLENLEASRGKTMKKLSITVSKFDELHHLCASLLSEVEKLQSQLQDRDAEISFLRQEVTRCTNDALVSSQMSSKRNSDEVHDLLTWLDMIISRVQVLDVHTDEKKSNQVHEYKEMLQKQIISVISELEDLRLLAQNRDTLLQVERSRVEELTQKEQFLENSLRDKESQLTVLRGVGDPGQASSTASEIMEVETTNKWTAPGSSIAPQVRSLRKSNNEQVAIAIDMDEHSGGRLEDEDDKAHGFKSLTTSRIVPRFTRPVTDVIDGLWVSCDRALMRQPALRLGVIIYWAVLHAILTIFVV